MLTLTELASALAASVVQVNRYNQTKAIKKYEIIDLLHHHEPEMKQNISTLTYDAKPLSISTKYVCGKFVLGGLIVSAMSNLDQNEKHLITCFPDASISAYGN